jgi:hypothetical protein
MSMNFRIGDLAKQTGVTVVTIRYYEQAGLLPACERTSGNYRVYAQEHLSRTWILPSANQGPAATFCSPVTDLCRDLQCSCGSPQRCGI